MRWPCRRWIVLGSLLAASASACHAETVTSVGEAWQYLTKSASSERWVVISSKVSEGYFQCENLDTFVGCSIPVWRQVLPGTKLTATADTSIGKPYPALPGSERTDYLAEGQVAAARGVLKRFGLGSRDAHLQLVDVYDKKKAVGTMFEVRVVLELDYPHFPELVEAYMVEVWGTGAEKGYDFATAD